MVAILLASTEAFSQAQLLKDVNTNKEPYYSEIKQFANVGSVTYFISASDLWRTDGTATNTIKLRTFTTIHSLTPVGTTLYFVADNGSQGLELWKTNGTASGTVIVRDIRAGSAGSAPLDLVNANGTLYFTANNSTNGKEVWKSNGTSAGTVMVRDIFPGSGSSGPNRLTNVNGIVYFQANDNVNGYELWKTNGTSSGTVMVKDIRTGSRVGSFPELLTNVNGTLYFVAADNTTGRELWKSNGTAAGTVRVKDIVTGSGSPMIDNSTNVNGVLYFTANDGTHGKELWKSNGTSTGTVMVKDIKVGSAGADGEAPMGQFTVLNGKLYFIASSSEYGAMQLYTTDGTAAGTKVLRYLAPIMEAGYNLQLTWYKNQIYFFDGGYEGPNDDTPVVYLNKMNADGTGAAKVKQIFVEYYAQSFPAKMIAGSPYLLFSGRLSTSTGYQLNRSDGTTAGTVPVKDTFVSTGESRPYLFATVGNVTYFVASPGNGQWNLYRTDGTPGGTVALLTNFSQFRDLTRVGGRLFFFAKQTFDGVESLYKVESATSAPVVIKTGMVDTWQLTAVGNMAYFAQHHYQPSSDDLWRSDGTSAGTYKIKTFNSIKNIFNFNGTAMLGVLITGGLELWKSTGTASSTVKITNMTTSTFRHYELRPYDMVGGIYYFGLENGTHGFEMWRTNGTASGTFMIQDLRTNDTAFPMDYDIADAAAFKNQLYFVAKNSTGGWSLFKTGSTMNSIVKIRDITVGGSVKMVALTSRLNIFVETLDNKTFLWGSDGTAAGTTISKEFRYRVVTDIDPAVINDVMYFNTSPYRFESEFNPIPPTPDEGMWRSDGTACGTFVFQIGAYRPSPMVALGTRLIFRGYRISSGFEPYSYNTTGAPASPCGTPDARIATTESEEQKLSSGEEEMLTFAPNPFTNELRFSVNGGEEEKAQVIIYAITGAPVETMENLEMNTEYTVGQNWAKGIYIMKVNIEGRVAVEKVIKE